MGRCFITIEIVVLQMVLRMADHADRARGGRYTFNDFGSKVPLQEFRPTTIDAFNRTIVLDAEDKVTMNVFMEMYAASPRKPLQKRAIVGVRASHYPLG